MDKTIRGKVSMVVMIEDEVKPEIVTITLLDASIEDIYSLLPDIISEKKKVVLGYDIHTDYDVKLE